MDEVDVAAAGGPAPEGERFEHQYLGTPLGVGEGLGEQSAAGPIDAEHFRLLAENIPTLCWMANGDGYIFWYNRRWYGYTGTTPAEMEGWGWRSVHHPEALPGVMERWTGAVARGEPFEMTFPLRGADGVFRPFLTRIQPLRDRSGRVTRWFGVNTDVSAQVAAEEALRASETRARHVLEGMTEGFVLLAPDFRVLDINAEGLRLETRRRDEIVGRSHWEVWPHTEDSELGRLYRRAMSERVPVSLEHNYRWPDGREAWMEMRAYPVPDGLAVFYRDITGRKQAAAALRELNATLEARVEERTRELLAAEEALRQSQKMEAVGQLTGGVAHDFNNLLTIISGNLELMQRRLPGDAGRLRYFTDNALQGAKRAATLTQRLLAFSRRQPLQPKPLSVNKVVSGMEDMLSRALGEEVEVQTVLSGGLWMVEADPAELESALLNLAVNARDAMPGGGKLTIETANAHLDEGYASTQAEVAPGQYVMISVTDTGTGMPKEVLDRVFEPFFTTKEVGQGTGLGLSQVYGFVKQSGGHVKAYSEVGEGTSLKIYLPRLHSAAESADAVSSLNIIPEGGIEETILVVEDDHQVRAFTVEVLRDLGYRVLEAPDGPAAMGLLEGGAPIDALFTDVVLPGGMSGRDVAERALERRPELKVLYTSGYSRNAIVHQGRLDAGVQLIGKPFAYADLAARLRDLLDG